jgi:hypothetical protein
VHGVNGALSMLHAKVEDSSAANSNLAEVDAVVSAGAETILVSGGVVSGTTVSSMSTSSK